MNLGHIKTSFQDDLGIAIYAESSDESRLDALLATRNAIEHSDCKVTKEYIRLTGAQLAVGDSVPAGPTEVGETLALIEHLANHINSECMTIWAIGR
jgi:hypothetical protein